MPRTCRIEKRMKKHISEKEWTTDEQGRISRTRTRNRHASGVAIVYQPVESEQWLRSYTSTQEGLTAACNPGYFLQGTQHFGRRRRRAKTKQMDCLREESKLIQLREIE